MAMTKTQFLLVKLAEEAAELSQIALKTAQFGLHEVKPGQQESNLDRVRSEFRDVVAHATMLDAEVGTDLLARGISQHVSRKASKVERYLTYSRSLGQVE